MQIKRIVQFWIILIILLTASGCASDQAFRYYLSEKLPPKNPSEVEILHSKPTRPYILIADLQIRNASQETIRKEAAKIGADAVIITHLGGFYDRGEKWAGEDQHKDSKSRLIASAIKYK
ncbi:MAG: hypothetical protein AB3N63_17150 [Puniceicoccaceae bacterium]